MFEKRPTSRALAALLALAAISAAAVSLPSSSRADTVVCGGTAGYSYAGMANAEGARGIVAAVTTLAAPQVQSGHVAAWVGIGGLKVGPNGEDEWLQAGIAALPDGSTKLYTEVVEPGSPPRLTVLDTIDATAPRHQLAVVELPESEWWQIWIDGRWIGRPVHLPGSDGTWRPIATAESYDGGKPVCNRFRFRFDVVAVARAWADWEQLEPGEIFEDPGYQVIERPTGFLARSAGY